MFTDHLYLKESSVAEATLALQADLIKAAADLEQSLLGKLGPEGYDGAATSEDADIRV